jgi:hypothetical protein
VVQADLQGPSGAGLSLEQATRNVAGQLRALINSNSDATVVAGGSGAVIQLEAKDSGSEGEFTVEVTVSGLADLLRVDSATATKDKINSLSLSGKAAALSSYFDAHSADTGLHYSTLKPDTQVLELRAVGEGGHHPGFALAVIDCLGHGRCGAAWLCRGAAGHHGLVVQGLDQRGRAQRVGV